MVYLKKIEKKNGNGTKINHAIKNIMMILAVYTVIALASYIRFKG